MKFNFIVKAVAWDTPDKDTWEEELIPMCFDEETKKKIHEVILKKYRSHKFFKDREALISGPATTRLSIGGTKWLNKAIIDINIIRGNKMPDLRIQTAIDNGDLPEQLELFEDQDPKQISLFDIFDKERLKEFLNERDNK